MDLVLKLREIRRLSQKDVARLSGVGEKTISSFETGQRIGSLKLAQLKRMLGVYGLTEAEFFGGTLERMIEGEPADERLKATSNSPIRSTPHRVFPSLELRSPGGGGSSDARLRACSTCGVVYSLAAMPADSSADQAVAWRIV